MGIASFIAGIGVHLAVYSRVLPLIVMGSLSVAGALTSIFLPETLNIHLPQTVEEGELFGADFKLWSCPTIPKLVISLTKGLGHCKTQSRILFKKEVSLLGNNFYVIDFIFKLLLTDSILFNLEIILTTIAFIYLLTNLILILDIGFQERQVRVRAVRVLSERRTG